MEENLPKFENREELVVNSDMAIDLRKAMSWAKFLSIMMFIGTGMMFLLSIVCFAVDPSTWFDNDMEPGAGGILGWRLSGSDRHLLFPFLLHVYVLGQD